jgi:K+-transporting ATPase KdpF subunit
VRKIVKDPYERPSSLIGAAGAFSVASITRTFLGMAELAAENSTGFCKNYWEKIMETLIVGLIALALFVYLFIAMVHPEKF